MPDRSRKKRPRDANQLAKLVADIATGDESDQETSTTDDSGKNQAAVALGRLGGKKGGRARAVSLSAERRQEIARKAAQSRWTARDNDGDS